MTQSGLDRLIASGFSELRGCRIGVVCNQATVAKDCVHILDHMLPHHGSTFEIVAAFGPQHGIWGHTQDNMIEWEGYLDPATGLRFYSLYGEHRKPTKEMLESIDLLVFDVQDVGARYYTFMWTLMLCMERCEEMEIPVLVLDRPNPLTGDTPEGTVLEPAFNSFVGLRPLPMRHAMTIGEIAKYFRNEYYPQLDLRINQMVNWHRGMDWEATRLPWVMPSPNMPTPDTAWVYPGMCLFEGTQLSEGRGTTRPFEQFGAPFINGRDLCLKMNDAKLPGVRFRPITFQPTFQKFAEQTCEGAFIHVVNRGVFKPVLTAVALLRQIIGDYGEQFKWLDPPYEYETEKLPIDILFGNSWMREGLESQVPLEQLAKQMQKETLDFEPIRQRALIYSSGERTPS